MTLILVHEECWEIRHVTPTEEGGDEYTIYTIARPKGSFD